MNKKMTADEKKLFKIYCDNYDLFNSSLFSTKFEKRKNTINRKTIREAFPIGTQFVKKNNVRDDIFSVKHNDFKFLTLTNIIFSRPGQFYTILCRFSFFDENFIKRTMLYWVDSDVVSIKEVLKSWKRIS